MNLTVINGGTTDQQRKQMAENLRFWAHEVEAGRCTDLVAMYVHHGEYRFRVWSTRLNAVALTAMAHDEALRQMRTTA